MFDNNLTPSLFLRAKSLLSLGNAIASAQSITLNPVILGCISGLGILIQGYLTKNNIITKIEMCKFAYTSYKKITAQLKFCLSGDTE